MKIIVSYQASIPDQELLDNGVDLSDKEAIEEYFYEWGGENEFHDHGLTFEILKDS